MKELALEGKLGKSWGPNKKTKRPREVEKEVGKPHCSRGKGRKICGFYVSRLKQNNRKNQNT